MTVMKRGGKDLLLVIIAVCALAGACSSGGAAGDGGTTMCGSATCTANQVCVRTQTMGGALLCPEDGGTCPDGYELAGNCCVMTPSYACVARPSACGATVTCACAMTALCTGGHTCTMPRENEIDCTLLAP